MAINPVEAAVLLVWAAGVIAAMMTVSRQRGGLRAWTALLVALCVPVVGSLLAIAYGLYAAKRRHRQVHQSAPG